MCTFVGLDLLDDAFKVPRLRIIPLVIFRTFLNGQVEWFKVISPVIRDRHYFAMGLGDNLFYHISPLSFEDISDKQPRVVVRQFH